MEREKESLLWLLRNVPKWRWMEIMGGIRILRIPMPKEIVLSSCGDFAIRTAFCHCEI
jgi:hypothetical protein